MTTTTTAQLALALATVVGSNVRRLREGAGLSQTAFVRDLPILLDASQLSRYENGHSLPTLPTAMVLAEALGVTLDELVREQG